VVMEACASAHYWGREIMKLGHEVRLIPPIYVKPFVKRQKNDAADAEAICEAALRPTMRFVAVKGEEQQARGMLFRTRDLLVRQRTQAIKALSGHLAEFGIVAPQGRAHVARLAAALDEAASDLPAQVHELSTLMLERIADLHGKIAGLEKDICVHARRDEEAAQTMRQDVPNLARKTSGWPNPEERRMPAPCSNSPLDFCRLIKGPRRVHAAARGQTYGST